MQPGTTIIRSRATPRIRRIIKRTPLEQYPGRTLDFAGGRSASATQFIGHDRAGAKPDWRRSEERRPAVGSRSRRGAGRRGGQSTSLPGPARLPTGRAAASRRRRCRSRPCGCTTRGGRSSRRAGRCPCGRSGRARGAGTSASQSRIRLQAGDELDEVRAVVGVDDADAAVAEDVVAREEQGAHPEGELAGGVAGRAPDLQRPVADRQDVPLVDRQVDLAAGHRDVDVLGVDPGVGEDLVPLLERRHALGMGGDLALEDLAGPASPWVWSASACVARIILQAERLKSIWRISSRTSASSSRNPTSIRAYSRAAVDQVDVDPEPAPSPARSAR